MDDESGEREKPGNGVWKSPELARVHSKRCRTRLPVVAFGWFSKGFWVGEKGSGIRDELWS
jgi:hypothetical protein